MGSSTASGSEGPLRNETLIPFSIPISGRYGRGLEPASPEFSLVGGSSPHSPTISRKERPANNLVGNHHFKNPFAFHTSNRLAAHRSKSRSGANVNNLFLSALRASNRHNEVGQFSGAGHLQLGAADSTTQSAARPDSFSGVNSFREAFRAKESSNLSAKFGQKFFRDTHRLGFLTRYGNLA